jgi:hypothetical protein
MSSGVEENETMVNDFNWNDAQDALLTKIEVSVNEQLRRQYDRMTDSLRDFLHDLFNYPLERPWRQTLAGFSSHWQERGLKLSDRTISSLERLIADRLESTIALAQAGDSASTPPDGSVVTDAAVHFGSSPTSKEDQAKAQRKEATRRFLRQREAKITSQNEKTRLQLTENERVRLEFFLAENLRRAGEGEPLLPYPGFWLEAQERFLAIQEAQPSIRGLTKDEAERSEWQAKLANFDKLPPGERAVINYQIMSQMRAEYTEKHGYIAAFFNPAFSGTGNFNDAMGALSGFAGHPGRPTGSPSLSPNRPRGKNRQIWQPKPEMPKPDKAPNKPRPPKLTKKPGFPVPVDSDRLTNRRGKKSPHPHHVLADLSETDAARLLHSLPDVVVIYWGQRQGKHGADVITYNLKTKIVTLWDVKYRSSPVRLQPSKTFSKDSSREKTLDQARKAIHDSGLSPADKSSALLSLANRSYQTRTLGAGNAKNSTIGDDR